eukprot:1187553-Prymnesium_polylepis.3
MALSSTPRTRDTLTPQAPVGNTGATRGRMCTTRLCPEIVCVALVTMVVLNPAGAEKLKLTP